LKNWGVSVTAAEPAAKVLFKMFLMQQLTRTNGFTPPQGAPQTLPVNTTVSYPSAPQSNASATSSPLSVATAKNTASSIRSLSPQTTGQGMSHTLGVSMPGKINMSSSLS
ncbi:MAG TPA: hypothetical protein VIJ14_05125, partial [Rhabdochlamydiaceae bacterium]